MKDEPPDSRRTEGYMKRDAFWVGKASVKYVSVK